MKLIKKSLLKWTVLLFIVLLQLLTVLVLKNTERFNVAIDQFLEDPEFIHGEQHWKTLGGGKASYNNNSVSMVNEEQDVFAIYQNFLVEESGFYFVELNLEVLNLNVNSEFNGRVEVLLVYRNESGKRNGDGKIIFTTDINTAKDYYSEMIHLGDEVGSVDFAVRFNKASGKITVDSPVVSKLSESSSYGKVSAALIILWCVILCALGVVAIRFFSTRQFIFIGVMASIALVGVLLPADIMNAVYNQLSAFVPLSILERFAEVLAELFGYEISASSISTVSYTHLTLPTKRIV